MSIFKVFILIILEFFFFGSFSLKNHSPVNSIEVFYYDNKGAWTEVPDRIVSISKKKCLISKKEKVDEIIEEVTKIESTKSQDKFVASCSFVIRINHLGKTKIIGFDNEGNNTVEINNKLYNTSGKLLKFIKRNCICKWTD